MVNRAQLYRYKGDRCTSCGVSVQDMIRRYGKFERLFELHHVNPSTKDPNYKNLIRQRLSAKQIEEVDKCTLLCGQCHSVLHAQNITAKLQLAVTLGDREVNQTLSGWLIVNRDERTAQFVTNQRLLLQPCMVAFGNGQHQILCCVEIERNENLLYWMHHAVELGRIEISSYFTNKPLMLIEPTGPKSVKVTQTVGFPVMAIDMAAIGSNVDNLWVRNGYLLTRDGRVHTKGSFSFNCDLRGSDA